MMGETRIVVRKDAEGVAREAVALWRRHAADAGADGVVLEHGRRRDSKRERNGDVREPKPIEPQ